MHFTLSELYWIEKETETEKQKESRLETLFCYSIIKLGQFTQMSIPVLNIFIYELQSNSRKSFSLSRSQKTKH